MRRLSTFLALLILIGLFGLYRGWFHLTSQPNPANPSVTITVDKNKINTDTQTARHDLKDLEHQAESQAAAATQKATNAATQRFSADH